MSRGTKGIVLVALLGGIVASAWTLARGSETAWLPFGSEPTARFVFRILTIAMGLGAWFVSQSLIGARGLREGAIGDAVHDWTAPLNRWLVGNPRAANTL